MLKLKYLFDNRDLAMMLLNYWDFDQDSSELLGHYRISSNAVYPFKTNGKINFLRFTPLQEKSRMQLQAELDFIHYLSGCGYPAATLVRSKDRQQLVQAVTPWGEYLAVVFGGVSGRQLEKLEYSDELYYGYGKALGRLHLLSQDYQPLSPGRNSWEQQLIRTRDILTCHSAPASSVMEVDILLGFLRKIDITEDNYGLIHYDFELDNVFFDERRQAFHVIDFDDCVYHWLAMDIERTLNSMTCELSPGLHQQAKTMFLNGYRTEHAFTTEMEKLLPVFHRYAAVHSYARCLHATADTWQNEPEWMVNLRAYLDQLNRQNLESFGKPIRL